MSKTEACGNVVFILTNILKFVNFSPHVTSGNVTVSRTSAFEGTFSMPEGDVTIELTNAGITAAMPGDWIAYDTAELPAISLDSSATGNYSYYNTPYNVSPGSYSGGWRVLSNDGTKVRLISTSNVASGLILSYSPNFTTLKNKLYNGFLNSTYANSATWPTTSDYALLVPLGMQTPDAYTGNFSGSYYVALMSGGKSQIGEPASDGTYVKYSQEAHRPVITLNSGVKISGGNGTKENPFILSVE